MLVLLHVPGLLLLELLLQLLLELMLKLLLELVLELLLEELVLLLLTKHGILLVLGSGREVEALKLLGSCLDPQELLLELLLLLSKVHIGGHQLGIEIGVHAVAAAVIKLYFRRG